MHVWIKMLAHCCDPVLYLPSLCLSYLQRANSKRASSCLRITASPTTSTSLTTASCCRYAIHVILLFAEGFHSIPTIVKSRLYLCLFRRELILFNSYFCFFVFLCNHKTTTEQLARLRAFGDAADQLGSCGDQRAKGRTRAAGRVL